MSKYYKQVENGRIISIGTNCGGIEITQSEYSHIMNAIFNHPEQKEGYDLLLMEDLTWEERPTEETADE